MIPCGARPRCGQPGKHRGVDGWMYCARHRPPERFEEERVPQPCAFSMRCGAVAAWSDGERYFCETHVPSRAPYVMAVRASRFAQDPHFGETMRDVLAQGRKEVRR